MNGIQNLSISNSTTNEKKPTLDRNKMKDAMKKSAAISEKTRKEGNKLFARKNHSKILHKDILWAYSKSVAYAPENSEQLAAAYSNRSVLLIHLGRNEESLADIDRALQITKSEALLIKLVARKGQLVSSNPDLIKSLDPKNSEHQSLDKQNNNEALSLPSIIKPSTKIPCASESVILEYNETFGRHYVSARDMKPGEIIMVEEGYICVPKNNLRYLLCSHCLVFSWNGIPCSSCPFAIYCSEDCKQEAWQDYHDIECSIFPHLDFLRSEKNGCVMADIAISLRIFLKALKKEGLDAVLDEAEAIDYGKDNKVTGLLTKGVLQNNKFRACYNLSSNVQYNLQKQRLIAYTTDQLINVFLQNTNILDTKKISENKISDMLFAQLQLILNKLRHIVDINALSYQGNSCKCPELDETECSCGSNRGVIIAPSSSLVNHSCCSNLSRIFLPKKKVIFFTITSVKKGEQLCDSYGPSIRMERETRKELLLRNFHFTCKCKACTENWPHELEMHYVMNTKTVATSLYQIIYDFKKVYPKENELFIYKDPEEIWGINKEGLEKGKLTCKLIFEYVNDYMTAFWLCLIYRHYIDKVIFNLNGEKCSIPSVCCN